MAVQRAVAVATPPRLEREKALQQTSPPHRKKMTYQEFLAWADEDTLAEWVNGEVVMTSPASRQHQEIVKFLAYLLDSFVAARRLGKVLFAPFQVKLGPDLPGREPDLLFIAREHLGRLRETYLEGPPDLIVEVTSPESQYRDRGAKFYEYEAAGVGEYWLIDPHRRQAEFYQPQDGVFRPVPPDAEGIYRSAVLPGFWLRVDWLWQDPLPTPLEALHLLSGMLGDAPVAQEVQSFLRRI